MLRPVDVSPFDTDRRAFFTKLDGCEGCVGVGFGDRFCGNGEDRARTGDRFGQGADGWGDRFPPSSAV